MRIDNRITRCVWDPEYPVNTAWDFGYSGFTVIIFFQLIGRQIYCIDYIQMSREPLVYYFKFVKSKPYTYDKHFVPHDAAMHDYEQGNSRLQAAQKHGITFSKVDWDSIDNGINVVMETLDRVWIDDTRCLQLVKCLDEYKRQWNEKQGCWSNKHVENDQTHGADAFRMLCTGLRQNSMQGPTDEWVKSMEDRHRPSFSSYS
jgi:hypothetical protein